ncbi:MAG: ABC transporter substrate-binding protein [Desulfobacterales bacterium]|nr:ABC transporter substrate-binding protein [Desulfobacterales bacterium]MBF0395449.1 ABC transporter substrate-binding protein [Desulfobacterales bacterium]
MNKKKGFILLLITGVSVIIILILMQQFPLKTKAYYIAVVGPMGGEDKDSGKSMKRGIQLCLDNAKKEGRLKGKKIELLFLNDQNDRRTALKVASQITDNERILLVLGHYYSLTSEIAATMYKKSGIPAITASATSDTLTLGNESYFRLIPANHSMAAFIANYISKILKQNKVSIIYDKDEYGSSLNRDFQLKGKELGIEILNQWSFDRENKDVQRELRNIIADIRTIKEPGILFFATHAQEAVQILSSLKYRGTDYTVIGPDSFCSQLFINLFNSYPSEKQSKGYYTNGIYAMSPYLSDLGGKETRQFVSNFEKIYYEKPSWVAICYYDAMLVAINALEKIDTSEGVDARDIRRTLRDRLAGFNSNDTAIEGISGKLFFDRNGNMKRQLNMGLYQNQILMPFFTQYMPIEKSKGKTNEQVLSIDNQLLTDTQIIYAGFDLIEISNLNIKEQTYTLDFYLWFRFQGEFDPENIYFTDAVVPINLGKPILEETAENIKTVTYRIKGNFRGNFNLKSYPFDSQSLQMRFYNKINNRAKLIYIPDILSSYDPVTAQGFKIDKLSYYEDIKNVKISNKIKLPYSQFNAEIILRRADINIALKIVLPIIGLLGILCFVYYSIPSKYLIIRIASFLTIIFANIIYHEKMLANFSGKKPNIEYAFFALYALITLAVIISLSSYIISKNEK